MAFHVNHDRATQIREARLRLAAVNTLLDSVIAGDNVFDTDVVLDHASELLDQALRWLRAES